MFKDLSQLFLYGIVIGSFLCGAVMMIITALFSDPQMVYNSIVFTKTYPYYVIVILLIYVLIIRFFWKRAIYSLTNIIGVVNILRIACEENNIDVSKLAKEKVEHNHDDVFNTHI